MSSLIIFLLGIGGYGYNSMSAQIDRLTDLVKMLEHSKITLKKKTKTLTQTNNKLKSKNKMLKNSNLALSNRQKMIKNKITMQRKKIVTRSLNRSKKKLATAGAKMAPFLGIPIVVGAVTLDINDYCSDIKDMETFEYDLFGTPELKDSEYRICGIDTEKQLDDIANSVNQSYGSLLNSLNHAQDDTRKFWKSKLNETKGYFHNISEESKDFWRTSYMKTIMSLEKQSEETSHYWGDIYDDTLNFYTH